jgi:hypothetical protein
MTRRSAQPFRTVCKRKAGFDDPRVVRETMKTGARRRESVSGEICCSRGDRRRKRPPRSPAGVVSASSSGERDTVDVNGGRTGSDRIDPDSLD